MPTLKPVGYNSTNMIDFPIGLDSSNSCVDVFGYLRVSLGGCTTSGEASLEGVGTSWRLLLLALKLDKKTFPQNMLI